MGCSTLLLASAVSSVGGLIFGYELAIISGGLLQLKVEFRLSCVQQEALVSSLLVGALLASMVGGCLIDRRGRRNSIILSNALILTGSLVLLVSSYLALVFGRMVVGFAMCISSMSCCIFVSEMVTADRRGFLVTLYEAGITVGILVAYALNYILFNLRGGWRWMFGLAVVPAVVQLVSILFLPSSPGGSLSQNYSQAEKDVLETQEADNLDIRSGTDHRRVQYNTMYLFQRKDNMRTRTVIGLGLVLFQQFTGQPNVLFYGSTIFHSVGFQSNDSAVLATVGLGLVKVAATLASMVFSDRLGRRPLLIGGCVVMAVCLMAIGLLNGRSLMEAERPCQPQDLIANATALPFLTVRNGSAFDTPLGLVNNNALDDRAGQKLLKPVLESSSSVHASALNWVVLVCMMAVVSAYAIGFGPMTWLLLSEIFPAAVRGRAFAFINCFNWAANLLVTFTFLDVIDAIGLSVTFLLFGLNAVVAGVFFYLILPETKGKTLEQIDKELRLNRFDHSGTLCCLFRRRASTPHYHRLSTLEHVAHLTAE